jgi:hypothetical protein
LTADFQYEVLVFLNILALISPHLLGENAKETLIKSFPRRRESSKLLKPWIPAFAGMTKSGLLQRFPKPPMARFSVGLTALLLLAGIGHAASSRLVRPPEKRTLEGFQLRFLG